MSDDAIKPITLPKIQMLLGPFSISSVQMWLRMQKLTYSAKTRELATASQAVAPGLRLEAGLINHEADCLSTA